MRFAVIADIHGNYAALQAVLDDACAVGVEGYLFVGDYITDMPYAKEIVHTLRGLKNAVFVSGNREWYMDSLNPSRRHWEQFAGLFLTRDMLEEEGLSWVRSLPKSVLLNTPDGQKRILMEHVCEELYGAEEHGKKKLASGALDESFRYRDATREEVCAFAKEGFEANTRLPELARRAAVDVVIHGHSHLQYALTIGDVLYLNPGSCGLPLDHQLGAPYTLLCYENGRFSTEERRVVYNLEETLRYCESTPFYQEAKGWCELNFWQLRTARDHSRVFFQFLQEQQEIDRPQIDQEHNLALHRALARTKEYYKELDSSQTK